MKGIVFDIKHYAVHDGPGIRTTVFLKGCPLRCWWCHNPESQRLKPEHLIRMSRLDDWSCEEMETVGHTMTLEEVMTEIEKDRVFLDESGGGVTFSGGEPLLQLRFLDALLTECRVRDIHTCLDTTGFTAPAKFRTIIDKVDLFLYDIKLFDEEAHRQYTGVSNQWIFENLRTLLAENKKVILRFPVIPDITDAPENLRRWLSFLPQVKNQILQVDLLPYHDIAKGKYQRFVMENKMQGAKPPSNERMEELRNFFADTGVRVR